MAHKEKRVDVRVYLSPEEHEYLKTIANENGISMTELFRTCTLKKCKYPQKGMRQKISIPNRATPEPSQEEMENRLREVSARLQQAYHGEKLPHDEYSALKEEQTKLRSILGHN